MDNLEIWNRVKRPPESALKPILAGRLRGKTDISPQWRLQVMTEVFGPCGKGWTYKIDDLWTEPGSDGQVFAFAKVTLKIGESQIVPGVGGAMLVVKEKEGLHSNDEAFKMAVTDALSVAMKALGVAADIYLGLWDGSKYKTGQKPESAKSIGQAEYDNLPAAIQQSLTDLKTEVMDAFDPANPEKAYDLYAQTRDNLPDEGQQMAFRGLFPSNVRTAFTKIFNARKESK